MCPPSSFTKNENNPSNISDGHHPAFVPVSNLCTEAYTIAKSGLAPAIFNHSLRVYLYAQTLAQRASSVWASPERLPLMFVACLFHDMGTAAQHDGPQRFEVCGADAAVEHLRRSGSVSELDMQEVWTAIAVHTSPGIAERITPLSRFVRLAVLMDFNALTKSPWATASEVEVHNQNFAVQTEEQFPRLDAAKVLSDIVVEQGMRQATKAPAASWVGIMVRAAKEEPGWEGLNKAF